MSIQVVLIQFYLSYSRNLFEVLNLQFHKNAQAILLKPNSNLLILPVQNVLNDQKLLVKPSKKWTQLIFL